MSDAPQMFPATHAATHPEKPAIIMAESGAIMTYAELDDAANRLSRAFAGIGLLPGDHVAFCLENRIEFLAVLWGAHYAGLNYTAVSSRLTSDELGYILEDSGSRAFITSPYKAEAVAKLGNQLDAIELKLCVGGSLPGFDSYEDAIAAQKSTPLETRLEGQSMLYSSGTTGRPKGVKMPFVEKPLGTPEAVTLMIVGLLGANADSIYLSPAPLYHSAPLRYCTNFQRLGATIVVMEHFDAEGALAAIEKHTVTHSQWVPTMFNRMLKLPAETRARYDVSSLQCAIHAAAPCPVAIKEQMFEWWGPVIHEYYAGTEGNGFVYCSPPDWLAHKGSVGKAMGAPVHIVGEDGKEVPVGEEGAVYFAGTDAPSFEYHNDSEKTKASYLPNGWSTLGDIGKLDEDGFLYLTDRKANMIITGGVNVYPQETENVLTMHPRVADVAVFGVPNEDFGEEVKAVVQPLDMADVGEDFERELIAYCREHLADVKCPRSIDFREELPRHPTGKLYKRLLKDEYWAGHKTRIV